MSQIQVSIVRGVYRGDVISGVFPLIKAYQDGARGGFITIKNPGHKPGTPMVQRVQVEPDAFTLLDAAGEVLADHIVIEGSTAITNFESAFAANETEEEAMERIANTFLMLDKITDAAARGIVRGLVVSGPPGIGKSFGVEKQLEAANMFRKLAGKDPKYEVISGGVSSIGLYQKLYHNRSPENVLVFDDCDGVLEDSEMLNLLKAALNSGDKRRICWNKESRVLLTDDIPNAFDFEGSVLFLSNKDFEKEIERGSRIAVHLEAIMSRCHYLDLEIGSTRDKLLRIKQVVRDGMLTNFEFTQEQEDDIVAFVVDNVDYLRETSLRMVKKIADWVKADPDGWYEMAESTCLTKEAYFKRMLEKQKKKAEAAAQTPLLTA
jgi:hypothetical protein